MCNQEQNKHQYTQFCKIRTEAQRDIKISKDDYVSNKIEEYENSPKLLWEYLKFLGYTLEQRDRVRIGLNVADQTYHNIKEIVNHCIILY
jgi:hypothetical protein